MIQATQTMRAVRVSGYGGPEQLKLERIARPRPQAGEVLLRVHAAGALLQTISRFIDDGRLKVPVEKTFALSEVRQAHQESQRGHGRGRGVLQIVGERGETFGEAGS